MPEKLVNMTEPEIKYLLNGIAKHISSKVDARFMLVVFDDPGLAQYISNANREDCITAMEETAKRFRDGDVIRRDTKSSDCELKFRTYKVDYCLLADEFKEDGVEFGRISFVVRGGDNIQEHVDACKKFIEQLLNEHDEDYTTWVHTATKYKDLGGYDPHFTVLHFRIRDAH